MSSSSAAKPSVVVAMSGGVDSSLAAFLLKEKGYDVIGITMKLWDFREVGGDLHKDGRCCSLEAMNDARNVCQKLNIPHYVLDFKEEFKEKVISNFVEEFSQYCHDTGITDPGIKVVPKSSLYEENYDKIDWNN